MVRYVGHAALAIMVVEAVAVLVIYIFWESGWEWLSHCTQNHGRSGCSNTNMLVLFPAPAVPFVVAAVKWEYDARKRRQRDQD